MENPRRRAAGLWIIQWWKCGPLAGGPWERIGELPGYRGGPDLKPGQAFELKLDQPMVVAAIRVSGKANNYASCAELAAYED